MLKRRTEIMVNIARNPSPIVIEVPRNPNNNVLNYDFNEEFLMCDNDDTDTLYCNNSEITINEGNVILN